MKYKKILILGGTQDSAKLADKLFGNLSQIELITSLAGRTNNPRKVSGEVIIGGFWGPNGLMQFIKDKSIELVIKNETIDLDNNKYLIESE